MWTFFKRECEDTWGFMLAIVIITAGSIAYAELPQQTSRIFNTNAAPVIGYCLLCLLLLGIGSSRMAMDRIQSISTFFTGHLITRSQVFAVRVLMGILFIILFYIPLLCWACWRLLQELLILPVIPVGNLSRLAILLFLVPMACYCLGLRMGQINAKIIPLFGTLILSILLLSFVVIKGFYYEAIILLAILNLSLVYLAWQKYSAAAL